MQIVLHRNFKQPQHLLYKLPLEQVDFSNLKLMTVREGRSGSQLK